MLCVGRGDVNEGACMYGYMGVNNIVVMHRVGCRVGADFLCEGRCGLRRPIQAPAAGERCPLPADRLKLVSAH